MVRCLKALLISPGIYSNVRRPRDVRHIVSLFVPKIARSFDGSCTKDHEVEARVAVGRELSWKDISYSIYHLETELTGLGI